MSLGLCYKENEVKFDKYINKSLIILSICVYVIYITIMKVDYNFDGSMYFIDAIMLSSLGLLVVTYISKKCRSHFIEFVGANTLLYFAIHAKVLALIQRVIYSLVGFPSVSMLGGGIVILVTLLVASVLVVPALFVNKYLPWVLGKNFKMWYEKKPI